MPPPPDRRATLFCQFSTAEDRPAHRSADWMAQMEKVRRQDVMELPALLQRLQSTLAGMSVEERSRSRAASQSYFVGLGEHLRKLSS